MVAEDSPPQNGVGSASASPSSSIINDQGGGSQTAKPTTTAPTTTPLTTTSLPKTPSASTAGQPQTTGQPQAQHSTGISGGAVAGAAIGGLIVGVAIAAAVFYLLWFRRRKALATAHGYPEAAYGYSEGKPGATTTTSMSISIDSAAAIVERNLPDPIADNDIISEFSKVDDKINGHVNSFYMQSRATDHTPAAQAIVQLLGAGNSLSLQKIIALLANPQSRPTVLRHAISMAIVSRMDTNNVPTNALLPFGTAASIRGMPKVQENDATRMAFLTKWRAITAYLMGIPSNTNTVSDENIRQTVLDCEQIVGSYATPTIDQQARLQNLEEICRRAGRVAGILFSQQALFKFDWQQSVAGLVVFPGLVKLTDETGRIMQQPLVFAEKTTVQV